jgi:hypothetical protein
MQSSFCSLCHPADKWQNFFTLLIMVWITGQYSRNVKNPKHWDIFKEFIIIANEAIFHSEVQIKFIPGDLTAAVLLKYQELTSGKGMHEANVWEISVED